MKFKHLTNILALASCALILWGCPKTPEQEDPKISANPTSVIFENTASTQTVTVASNRAWTVSVGGVDWLTATPASKSGDSQESTVVTLTAKANDGALREATVTFKTATISATVKVTQKAAAGTEVTYTAISKLWDTYKDQVAESGKSVDLPVGVNVKARVISNIADGNCNNKSMYIEDGIDPYCGICVRYSSSDKNVIEQGAEVTINMDGGTISNYNGTIQLTPKADDNIVKTATAAAVQAPVAVKALTSEVLTKYQSMYIATPKVQVVESALKGTMAGSVTVQDEAGETIAMYSGTSSSQTASWGSDAVPQGSGILNGIFVPYGSTLELLPQTKADWSGLTGARFTVAEGEATLVSIASVRNAASGSISDNNKIKGIVTSSAKNKVNSSKTVFMQDGKSAKSGIMLYVSKAADNTFEPGDEIEVKLKGASKTVYNGSDEISISDDGNITKTATPNAAVDPLPITVDQLKKENADWQSMYVIISDSVQVVKDSLNKMMTGNVIMETANGTQFASYTRAGSAWADMKVPQGSGKLKGVASIYQGKTGDPVYQVLPQVESDWNTLTGPRFGSVIPSQAEKKSIADINAMNPATSTDTTKIIDDIYVVGTVVGCVAQNFNKYAIAIEDGEAAKSGMYIYCYNSKNGISGFALGDEVKVNLQGAMILKYNNINEVSVPSIDKISKTETASAVKAPVKITLPQYLNGDYNSMYVELDGFQAITEQVGQTMNNSTNKGTVKFETVNKDTIVVYTNSSAAIKDVAVPSGSGNVMGVVTPFKAIQELLPQTSADISLTGERFVPGGSTGPAAGTVLLEDNFDWITNVYCGDANHRSTLASGDTLKYYSKYGWPSSTNDYQNYNEYNVDNDTINTREQLRKTFQANYKTFARYEGFLKWGDSKNRGYAETVPMIGLGTATADLLVSFDAAIYANPAGVTDVDANAKNPDPTHDFVVAVNHGGTINETSDSTINIAISNFFSFRRYYVLVKGANAATTITFGDPSGDAYQERYYIDNLKIEVAASGATAPAPSTETTYLPYSAEVGSSSTIEANPFYSAVAIPEIRCSGPWTATSDADWLMFYDISDAYNTIGGITISEDGKTVTNNGNGLPFNNNYAKVAENNTGAARTGHITVVDYNGKTIGTITVSQRAKTTSDVAPVYKGNVQMAAKVTSGSAYVNNITMLLDNPTDTIQMNVKLGKSGAVGAWSSQALPLTGDMTLTFFAGAWQFLPCDLKVTVVGGGTIEGAESVTRTVLPNPGFNNDTPYHIAFCFPENYFSFKLAGITAASTLKFETVLTTIYGTKAYRVCIAGANVTQ